MPSSKTTQGASPKHSILFTEDDHKYILKTKGGEDKQMISVTTLIGRYFPPFDADKIAPRVAAKRGVSVEEVKAEWKAIGDEASRYGTRVHEYMEDVLTKSKIRNTPENEKEEAAFRYALAVGKKFRDHFINLQCEKVICDPSILVAGTIDLLCQDPRNNGYIIFDWKTNKQISTDNSYAKGFPPIQHLSDCEFAHYALQLNMYDFILRHAGYLPEKTKINKYLVHIDWMNGINMLQIPDMQKEISDILDDYLTRLEIR